VPVCVTLHDAVSTPRLGHAVPTQATPAVRAGAEISRDASGVLGLAASGSERGGDSDGFAFGISASVRRGGSGVLAFGTSALLGGSARRGASAGRGASIFLAVTYDWAGSVLESARPSPDRTSRLT
jgi:hypothetical protein